jgi:hypothetical protein
MPAQEYGTGRARLGIDGSGEAAAAPPPAPADTPAPAPGPGPAAPSPTLGEYLRFGKMLGERVQDVQRQLDINATEVRVDAASRALLDEWQTEQVDAYAMFESLAAADPAGAGGATGFQSEVLLRNKNRVRRDAAARRAPRAARRLLAFFARKIRSPTRRPTLTRACTPWLGPVLPAGGHQRAEHAALCGARVRAGAAPADRRRQEAHAQQGAPRGGRRPAGR